MSTAKKESNEIIQKLGDIANIEQRILSIRNGNTCIVVNIGLKTAMRVQIPDTQINYLKLNPGIRKKYKTKELGEDIGGKSCQKLNQKTAQMEQTMQARVWIWRGIPLKAEMSTNGMVVITENMLDIQENGPVPADKFEVPEGIIIR
jgi:outer membrane lipoprotein-sorting protein